MIRISRIDDNLSIYKNNVVILLGIGVGTKQLIDLMRYHKIEIAYICDGGKNTVIEGIRVINPAKLKQMVELTNKEKNSADILIQISAQNMASGTENQLNSIGLNKIISYDEAYNVLGYMYKFVHIKSNKRILLDQIELNGKEVIENKVKLNDHFVKLYNEQLLLLCLPSKTGDNTLKLTFNKHNIKFYNSLHTPEGFSKDIYHNVPNKIKIITAIREPISRDISQLFQLIPYLYAYTPLTFQYEIEDFFLDGGDAQHLFNIRYDNVIESSQPHETIGMFITRFKENILDLMKYPFDKQKGYSIIQEGNIEVLVYQLEKMNDITQEVSDYIGTNTFNKWVIGNEANGKWISKSYEQTKRDITFSQEYFDKQYNDMWIQHFYSQEDIEKFKERWRPHIK